MQMAAGDSDGLLLLPTRCDCSLLEDINLDAYKSDLLPALLGEATFENAGFVFIYCTGEAGSQEIIYKSFISAFKMLIGGTEQ